MREERSIDSFLCVHKQSDVINNDKFLLSSTKSNGTVPPKENIRVSLRDGTGLGTVAHLPFGQKMCYFSGKIDNFVVDVRMEISGPMVSLPHLLSHVVS